jgi:hypothetical protein
MGFILDEANLGFRLSDNDCAADGASYGHIMLSDSKFLVDSGFSF